jgi:hypothetical protein
LADSFQVKNQFKQISDIMKDILKVCRYGNKVKGIGTHSIKKKVPQLMQAIAPAACPQLLYLLMQDGQWEKLMIFTSSGREGGINLLGGVYHY